MFNVKPWLARVLIASPLALIASGPAMAQYKALRNNDDQFIQGLREQGMSDLLERFVEADPPSDPIAQLALQVALNEFVADDLLARASAASQAGDFAQANELFQQSRKTFQSVISAQRQLIKEHADDVRLAVWQTDFTEMVIFRYLPRYFQNAAWVYEFGLPSEEQRAAYEQSMIESLGMGLEARFNFEELLRRVAAESGLRPQLEEMGVWYTIEDYRVINAPYRLAHAAHGVSLLPDDHAYFKTRQVRNQLDSVDEERKRLRNVVLDSLAGKLSKDERTAMTAKLLSGRTLVWSKKLADIDDGVDYLEAVIKAQPDTERGYLATLGKAVGRWNGGELDVALEFLGGMDRNAYVRSDSGVQPRLLASDLMFRILTTEAAKAPKDKQSEKIAYAYEKAYVPLIDLEDQRFRQFLFTRWAAEVKPGEDPGKYPATVRMGIGEQLTQQGGGEAQLVIQMMAAAPPAIPAEAAQWKQDIETKQAQAKGILDRAVDINKTLVGQGMQGPILARGLYNLGTNKYWLAELKKAMNGGQIGWQDHFEVARLWLGIGQRAPEWEKAEEALGYTINLLLPMDMFLNKESIAQPEVRNAYQAAFDLMCERWSKNPATQNNRVYAAFHLYERRGDLEKAIAIYRDLPPEHPDYYQARRQMLYAMLNLYTKNSDELLLLLATEPPAIDPVDATPEQKQKLAQQREEWAQNKSALEENITRSREGLVEEAELISLDAKDEINDGQTPSRRFTAATALGAAQVVLAGMEADQGSADKGIKMLDGFEARFAPDGEFAQLAALQLSPEGAKATLQGLVQSAQEQRIMILLSARRVQDMARQAQAMMDKSPDVAASVVNGVLNRITASIEIQERALREAVFKAQEEDAKANIKFFADAAVALSELLVQWAQAQGFPPERMAAYQMPLAEALTLAGRHTDSLAIIKPILELFPNNFQICMRAGKTYLAVYRTSKQINDFNSAMEQFSKIIGYYNQRPEKPAAYWEAWLSVLQLMEIAGDAQAKQISEKARILMRVDENLGGPAYKSKFEEIFSRNGGVELLPNVQPKANP